MIRRFAALAFAMLGLAACGTSEPGPGDYVAREIPIEQSRCELAANEYAQQHPDWLKGSLADRPDFPPFPFWGDAGLSKTHPSYRDPETGVLFRVEADGRHLSAFNSKGRLLWVRNPFVDSNMCPYRSPHPYIIEVGPLNPYAFEPNERGVEAAEAAYNAELVQEWNDGLTKYGCDFGVACARPQPGDRFVSLRFNSSQSGYLNIRTGDFYFAGQN